MDESRRQDLEDAPVASRRRSWDALGVVVASLIGLLALMVSGYTAYIQRQQVRAEVWPHLSVTLQDLRHQITVYNKGMGPAIVRNVRVTVDGKPQPDWDHVFTALGLSSDRYIRSSLSGMVLSPGDKIALLAFPQASDYQHFSKAMGARVLLGICYCSTLGDCWKYRDHHPPAMATVKPVDSCPDPSAPGAFRD